MATSAYWAWAGRGRPFRLATWAADLKTLARQHGVRWLGDLGNDDHLQASTPEDHTPFSATAWPVALPDYCVCAVDMVDGPWSDRILEAARDGRLPWVKYLNFRGRNYSVKRQWRPVANPDRHLHVSGRSDHTRTGLAGFNPFVARVESAPVERTHLMYMVQATGDPSVYVSDGMRRRHVDWDTYLVLRDVVKAPHVMVPDREALDRRGGPLDMMSVPVTLTAEQLDEIEAAAARGAPGPSLDEIERVVDKQLDEQARAGADNDGG